MAFTLSLPSPLSSSGGLTVQMACLLHTKLRTLRTRKCPHPRCNGRSGNIQLQQMLFSKFVLIYQHLLRQFSAQQTSTRQLQKALNAWIMLKSLVPSVPRIESTFLIMMILWLCAPRGIYRLWSSRRDALPLNHWPYIHDIQTLELWHLSAPRSITRRLRSFRKAMKLDREAR